MQSIEVILDREVVQINIMNVSMWEHYAIPLRAVLDVFLEVFEGEGGDDTGLLARLAVGYTRGNENCDITVDFFRSQASIDNVKASYQQLVEMIMIREQSSLSLGAWVNSLVPNTSLQPPDFPQPPTTC